MKWETSVGLTEEEEVERGGEEAPAVLCVRNWFWTERGTRLRRRRRLRRAVGVGDGYANVGVMMCGAWVIWCQHVLVMWNLLCSCR